jgi:hypothetical protein
MAEVIAKQSPWRQQECGSRVGLTAAMAEPLVQAPRERKYQWITLVTALSLERAAPFLLEAGLRAGDIVPLRALARRFIDTIPYSAWSWASSTNPDLDWLVERFLGWLREELEPERERLVVWMLATIQTEENWQSFLIEISANPKCRLRREDSGLSEEQWEVVERSTRRYREGWMSAMSRVADDDAPADEWEARLGDDATEGTHPMDHVLQVVTWQLIREAFAELRTSLDGDAFDRFIIWGQAVLSGVGHPDYGPMVPPVLH